MIHSLAGGELQDEIICNLAKVEFEKMPNQFFWYIFGDMQLKENDFVLAPFGVIDEPQKAKVITILNNVNSKNFPISFKKLKKIYKKLN